MKTEQTIAAHSPKVTVLMSVYNGERYLREAIDSILSQTFTDFELLIINDGSTDNSRAIMLDYDDARLRVIENEQRLGLAGSLNTGIVLAQGEYIVRMDADDISLPERLEKQVAFLDQHPDVAVVASHIQFIDANNAIIGEWGRDRKNATPQQIADFLPEGNCIAHPSIALRANILKRYRYRASLNNAQDWDLWMRLVADNHIIDKIREPLLLYRKHAESVTRNTNQKKRRIAVQFSFLFSECLRLHWNRFHVRVLKHVITAIDALYLHNFFARMYIKSKALSHYLRQRFWLWKTQRTIRDSGASHTIPVLFIIPHMEFGGGEKVCLDILSQLDRQRYGVSAITTRDKAHVWHDKFAAVTDNIWHLPSHVSLTQATTFVAHVVRTLGIRLIVINHSRTGYAMLPALRKRFPTLAIADLLQGGMISPFAGQDDADAQTLQLINQWQGTIKTKADMFEYSAPFAQYVDRRIVINEDLKQYLITQYQANPEQITVIHNGIDTRYFDPDRIQAGAYRRKFGIAETERVISFIGRLSAKKHPELILALAVRLREHGHSSVRFIIAGDGAEYARLNSRIQELGLHDMVFLAGYIDDAHRLLRDTDIFFLCSEVEGSPLVILEAMAMNVPVVSSSVGGIPELVEDGKDGYVIPFDDHFIETSAQKIDLLLSNADLYRQIVENARRKVQQSFSVQRMGQQYDELFCQLIKEEER